MGHRNSLAGPRVVIAVTAALAAMLMIAAPSQAATTITIKGKTHKGLRFSDPKKVHAGEKLTIDNLTNPKQVGPHSFSIVEKKYLPHKRSEYETCFDPGHLCNTIARAHEVDFQAETIGKRNVESGRRGWDRAFTLSKFGDSHVLFGKGERYTRRVTAKAGERLTFMCVIHPDMQGTIRVAK